MKSNIDIIKDYVAGVRPVIQVGYTGNKDKHRVDGERWTDSKDIEWERRDGKNIRLTKTQGEMIREMIDQKCGCGQQIKWGSKLDKYFFYRTGLCETCLVEYETKLRIVGVYDYYEKYKLLAYEVGSLKDWKLKLKEVIKFFTENNGDVELLCNSEGFTERWKNTNRDEILKTANNDFKFICEKLEEVIKLKEIARIEYVTRSEKNQLKYYV